MTIPERSVADSITIHYTINEAGVYRFVSEFKYNPDDQMKPLFSNRFVVVAE